MASDENLDDGIDLLWGAVDQLTTLSRAFTLVGNAPVARQLELIAVDLQEVSRLHTAALGQLTGQLMQTCWNNSANLLNASLAGLVSGSKDLDVRRSAQAMMQPQAPNKERP